MNNFYDIIIVILQILLLLCFSNKIVVNFQFNITNISYTRLLFTICERGNHIYLLFLVMRTPSSWKLCFLNTIIVHSMWKGQPYVHTISSEEDSKYWKVCFLNNFKFHSIYNLNCIVPKYLLIKKIWYHVKNKKC